MSAVLQGVSSHLILTQATVSHVHRNMKIPRIHFSLWAWIACGCSVHLHGDTRQSEWKFHTLRRRSLTEFTSGGCDYARVVSTCRRRPPVSHGYRVPEHRPVWSPERHAEMMLWMTEFQANIFFSVHQKLICSNGYLHRPSTHWMLRTWKRNVLCWIT